MHLYQEFPPHPALAAHVACLWTGRALPAGAPVRHRILPDNCIDILWQDRAPLGFVAGMMSRAHRVETAQPTLTVAVRFLPGAARAFFDLPLQALQDAHPALDDLWPRHEAEALAAALWEREQSVAIFHFYNTPARRDGMMRFSPTLETVMINGLRTVKYPVADLERAKAWFTEVLGAGPYFDQPFYVGFSVGGFELGLVPDGTPGTAGAVVYWGVDDIEAEVARIVRLGATEHEAIQEVGEGIKVAELKDPFGNVLGLILNPLFDPAAVR